MRQKITTLLGPTSLFVLMAALGTGCDLQTKTWAEDRLSQVAGRSISLFEPWLDMALSYNRGTSFSFFADLGDTLTFFGIFSFLMAAVIFAWVLFSKVGRLDALALGAIAAGAIGNGYDRMFRHAPGGGTGVVDFIKVNYPWGGSWPTFNVADMLIFCGVAVYAVSFILQIRRQTPPLQPTPD